MADVKNAARSTGRGTVFVFANLPHGQTFGLPGRQVTVAGWPVSALRGPGGEALPGGRYGVTEIDAGDWAEIRRIYGAMRIFQSGLVFAAPSREAGQAMAAERAELRHGLEPVDPEKTLTSPAKKDR